MERELDEWRDFYRIDVISNLKLLRNLSFLLSKNIHIFLVINLRIILESAKRL